MNEFQAMEKRPKIAIVIDAYDDCKNGGSHFHTPVCQYAPPGEL